MNNRFTEQKGKLLQDRHLATIINQRKELSALAETFGGQLPTRYDAIIHNGVDLKPVSLDSALGLDGQQC